VSDRDDEDEGERDAGRVPDLGSSRPRGGREPAGREPAKRSKSSSRSRSESKSKSETFDVAAIVRALGEAYTNGAAGGRHGFDGVQKALTETLGQLRDANTMIAQLQQQVVALSSSNLTIALLQAQTEQAKLDTAEKWRTVRDVAPKLLEVVGPNAAPLAGYLMRKFGIVDQVQSPKTGDKSPRAVAARVLMKLADGSDDSTTMIAMLRGYVEEVCKEDFGIFLQFFKDGVTAKPDDPEASKDEA